MKKILFILCSILVVLPGNILAHSGRTDSSGGHNCRTGACAGTYHYHNGGGTPKAAAQVYTPPAKTYTEYQYNQLANQNNELSASIVTLEKKIGDLTIQVSDIEKLNSEIKSLKQKETSLIEENKSFRDGNVLADLKSKSNKISNENRNLQVQVENLQERSNDGESGGFLGFLAGLGVLYGYQRITTRKDRKNEGVLIKGNITEDGEKVYYTTDNRYYSMVRLDTSKGERWFESEEEAIDAGWRKS